MTIDEKVAILREFSHEIRQFEEKLETFPPEDCSTAEESRRLELTVDSVARCRRQVGHLVADVVIGEMGDFVARE